MNNRQTLDNTVPIGEAQSGEVLVPREPTFDERGEYEDRILEAEMRAVALTRVLKGFAAKADKWEANHPSQRATDSMQIAHRLGDFRDAREAVAKFGINSGDGA